MRLMFSLPKPLGATVRRTCSPGTRRVYSTAGVLSPVLPRRMGSATTDLRKQPSVYPLATPACTAASKSPLSTPTMMFISDEPWSIMRTLTPAS